ncbi:hypothetical protein Droror1_Dr00023614, partial [Drosera rotundifolia]
MVSYGLIKTKSCFGIILVIFIERSGEYEKVSGAWSRIDWGIWNLWGSKFEFAGWSRGVVVGFGVWKDVCCGELFEAGI